MKAHSIHLGPKLFAFSEYGDWCMSREKKYTKCSIPHDRMCAHAGDFATATYPVTAYAIREGE